MPRVVKSPAASLWRTLRDMVAAWRDDLTPLRPALARRGDHDLAAGQLLPQFSFRLHPPASADDARHDPVALPEIVPLRLHLLGALIRLGDRRRGSLLLLCPILAAICALVISPAAGITLGIGLPVIALLIPSAAERQHLFAPPVDATPNRLLLDRRLFDNLQMRQKGYQTGLLLLQIDRYARLASEEDDEALDRLLRQCADRLRAVLRDGDLALRLEGATFAVTLAPTRRLDLDATLQLAARLQRAIATLPGKRHPQLTLSVGFALAARLDTPTPDGLVQAARLALGEALRAGPAAIRSYTPAMETRVAARNALADRVEKAIAMREIIAFFQPQMSTRTGALTGFEALARWHHPERGLIPPAEFLPALQQAGLMPQLGRHILADACAALHHWDNEGLSVPHVGVNFSTAELCDPELPAHLAAEIARHALTPDRICVEVLETVVAQGEDDIILHNLAALADMGCRLDLDDFGTGHASITNIRRFAIARIKIDRSFVTRVDLDEEQQNMMAAILTMAERLDLDTLAEGVETPEELARLTQMGCGHVQGFAIARPMPLAEATAWLHNHAERHAQKPLLLRGAG